MMDVSWSLEVSTPLGAGALSLTSFDGVESISNPFRFSLVASTRSAYIDPQQLVGKAIDVTLKGSDGVARTFNGIVSRFAQGSSRCTIEMRPWLWLLTLSHNSRIFQNLTVAEILAKRVRRL